MIRMYGHFACRSDSDGLATHAAKNDRVVRIEEASCPIGSGTFVDDGPQSYAMDGDAWWLRYSDGATYGVTQDRIIVDPPGTWEEDDRLCSQIMGLWLRRRGFAVLHANAVVREGRAILLMGTSGAGKSTLTRRLLDRGWSFASDDLGVVDVIGASPMLLPGPGRLKMRPQDGREFKVFVPVDSDPEPVRVAAAIVLAPGSPVALRAAGGMEAVLELVRHAHMPRSLHVTASEAMHFAAVSRLARSVRVYHLTRGLDLSEVDEAIDVIEANPMDAAA